MANYKLKNGKYYRLSSKGDWFRVERNKNGYLTWIQPDGLRVIDDTFKVPESSFTINENNGTYTVPLGSNGSVGRYLNLKDAAIAYQNAVDNYRFTEPSENVLNDLAFGTTAATKSLAAKNVGKTITNLVSAGKSLFTKEGAKRAVIGLAKETPKLAVSIGTGVGVDKTSEHFTGKRWSENVSDILSKRWGFTVNPLVGDFTNPGNYLGYSYGKFITNNYLNLGRYTLDNLYPAGYSLKQVPSAFKGYILALYKKPPTFFNHRPKWYNKLREGEFRETRFENGANWAGIPESEIPRKYFVRRPDGIVEPTYLNLNRSTIYLLPDKFTYIRDSKIAGDYITPGWVGGGHSDFIYLGKDVAGNEAILFRDRQLLNPQWQLSDWIKLKFKLKRNTPIYNIVHKSGGINLSKLLGYKPFTIEAGIAFPNGNRYKAVLVNLDNLKNVGLY